MDIGSSMLGAAKSVVSWGYGLLEKLVCRRAYALSTLYHDHRLLIEAQPYPLGEHLQYMLFWDEYLHGARQREPTIEVRTHRGVRLSKAVIAVSASNSKVCYQNEVVMRHVDERRHRAALPAIPFRYPKIKGNLVYTPYDEFRVELVEIVDESGKDLLPRYPVVHVTHPIDRLEVALGEEREYVEKWGEVYNLRFIELQAREEMVHILAWRFYRSPVVQKLTEPLLNRRVGKALFWIKNAVWARPLQRELQRHIAEFKEYAASRQKREDAVVAREEQA
ncbi:MAG: hypothetical protein ACT6S0_24880 [Roseateles sp.]|uniref:hypothetical protein n=1 Tax=Roseateles sp. TaxID=1971397 RepID=UPI0040365ADD